MLTASRRSSSWMRVFDVQPSIAGTLILVDEGRIVAMQHAAAALLYAKASSVPETAPGWMREMAERHAIAALYETTEAMLAVTTGARRWRLVR